MPRFLRCLAVLVSISLTGPCFADGLRVGFAEVDVTPKLSPDKPVYMAGFGHNRKATGVHDPIMARAVVLKDDKKTLAIVALDVVGCFHENVERVRKQLKGIDHVVINSTHNHEGPDTLGIWGASPFQRGVDDDYIASVEEKIVKAVTEAEKAAKPVSALIGTASAPELVRDSREPYVRHDELVAILFRDKDGKDTGVVVQWNCHPETLDSKNTELSADFVAATVDHLKQKYKCPVVYLTGTVGGLMTSLGLEVKDEKGNALKDGTFEKTERYGKLVGQLADKALKDAKAVQLTPFDLRARAVFLPMDNKLYMVARQFGVLKRQGFVWNDDLYLAEEAPKDTKKRLAIRSEVGYLRLGDLEVACIPGEIYPELVLDRVQDPPDKGADFPDAPVEPAIYKQLKGKHRMILGLACDEVGYIIPKRQWDEEAPFCYGRKKDQYGEKNSLGPETAPLLCRAFKELVAGK